MGPEPPEPRERRASADALKSIGDAGGGVGPSPADQTAEIVRLRRELDRVRMERDT